jgi:hypothetical protein
LVGKGLEEVDLPGREFAGRSTRDRARRRGRDYGVRLRQRRVEGTVLSSVSPAAIIEAAQ